MFSYFTEAPIDENKSYFNHFRAEIYFTREAWNFKFSIQYQYKNLIKDRDEDQIQGNQAQQNSQQNNCSHNLEYESKSAHQKVTQIFFDILPKDQEKVLESFIFLYNGRKANIKFKEDCFIPQYFKDNLTPYVNHQNISEKVQILRNELNNIQRPINLILLGPSGSGKSSTLNSIKSAYNNMDEIRQFASTGNFQTSVTTNFEKHVISKNLNIIDTIGFDEKFSMRNHEETNKLLIEEIKKAEFKSDGIIFVINLENFKNNDAYTKSYIKLIELYKKSIRSDIEIIFLFTKINDNDFNIENYIQFQVKFSQFFFKSAKNFLTSVGSYTQNNLNNCHIFVNECPIDKKGSFNYCSLYPIAKLIKKIK